MKFSFNFLNCGCSQLFEQSAKQLKLYKHRYKSRKYLLKLDENMLNDIGISKAQARQEGYKPFWKGDSFEMKLKKKIESKESERKTSPSLNNNAIKV